MQELLELLASPAVVATVLGAILTYHGWLVKKIHDNAKATTRNDARLAALCERLLGADPAERDNADLAEFRDRNGRYSTDG